MLNDNGYIKKGQILNKLGIVFKNGNFYQKFFNSDAAFNS